MVECVDRNKWQDKKPEDDESNEDTDNLIDPG